MSGPVMDDRKPVVPGVWVVYYHDNATIVEAIFPADQELEARRWADENGYSMYRVAFIEFGRVELP